MICILPLVGWAQIKLVIYHTIGTVNIISGSSIKKAARGNFLVFPNAIQLQSNGSCMLIDANGKSVQLTIPGVYSVDKIEKMIRVAGVNNVSEKFFKYVYDNLFTENPNGKMAITPVVFRGKILMNSPSDNSIIITPNIVFKWQLPDDKNAVHCSIRNNAQVIIDTVFKSGTVWQVKVSKMFHEGVAYEWKTEEAGVIQKQDIWFKFLVPINKNIKGIRTDLAVLKNKTMTAGLQKEIQKDMFEKWLNAAVNAR